jgi:hypothetical protein
LIDFMKGPKVAEGNVDTDVNIWFANENFS